MQLRKRFFCQKYAISGDGTSCIINQLSVLACQTFDALSDRLQFTSTKGHWSESHGSEWSLVPNPNSDCNGSCNHNANVTLRTSELSPSDQWSQFADTCTLYTCCSCCIFKAFCGYAICSLCLLGYQHGISHVWQWHIICFRIISVHALRIISWTGN